MDRVWVRGPGRGLGASGGGSEQKVLCSPEGWTFDRSLSRSFGYVPEEHWERSLTFLRYQDGLDVYRNE